MSTLENMYIKSFPDRVKNEYNKDQIFTPVHIAKEMVQAVVKQLKPEDWNKDLKVLDIYCKSGIFLYEFYLELFTRTKHLHYQDGLTEKEVEQRCREWILNNQLYGICTDPFLQLISIRTVYGHIPENSNIKYINNFDSLVNNTNSKLFWDTLKEQFGEETMKKFGVVIGNPPYNKGMDLDFVDKACQLSNNITCMITPAKWQTTADDYSGCASKNIDYKQFREKLVPHMNTVCFYPDCRDVFDISQKDGVTWYIMDKNTYEKIKIINKCKLQKHFNSVTTRKLIERERDYTTSVPRLCIV